MECGSSLTACSAHGSTPGQFFCPGAKHSFCCKEHCCHLTSFDGRIIAQKSDFVNRYSRKRGKKQEMGNGKLAQGCQSGVVGEGHAILRRQRQLMWGLVESNGFKFRRRVKNGKIFLKNTLKFYYYVLYCICKCFMECSSFSSARMGR